MRVCIRISMLLRGCLWLPVVLAFHGEVSYGTNSANLLVDTGPGNIRGTHATRDAPSDHQFAPSNSTFVEISSTAKVSKRHRVAVTYSVHAHRSADAETNSDRFVPEPAPVSVVRAVVQRPASGNVSSELENSMWQYMSDAPLKVAALAFLGCIVSLASYYMMLDLIKVIWPQSGKPAQCLAKMDGASRESKECPHARAELVIRGMTCSACAGTIERCLRNQHGVVSAAVNLLLESATVSFETAAVTPAEICEAVEDIGFEVVLHGVRRVDEDDGYATIHLTMPLELIDMARSHLGCVGGVRDCQALPTGLIRVMYTPCEIGARSILTQVRQHFPAHMTSIKCAPQDMDQTVELRRKEQELLRNINCSALPTAVIFVMTVVLPVFGVDIGSFDCLHYTVNMPTIITFALATPVQFYFGACFHKEAKRAFGRLTPNMDMLISVATTVTFVYAILILALQACTRTPDQMTMTGHLGHAGELKQGHVHVGLGCHALHFFGMGPILITVVLCGKVIEMRAKINSFQSLTELLAGQNHIAHLISQNGPDEMIPVELIEVGDTIRLFEGSRIPVDGKLCTTEGAVVWVNEALLTGESTPQEKTCGSLLMGGTTIVSGAGLMKATMVGSKTALGEIVGMISRAQASKTVTQEAANIFASYFVTFVMALSFAVFSIWLFLVETGRVALPPDMDDKRNGGTAGSFLFAANFGVAVLMVACPCAMGLATPTAVMVTTSVAAKLGCLVKSAGALESACWARAVVMDKTGTITAGELSVTDVTLTASLAGIPQELGSTLTAAAAEVVERQVAAETVEFTPGGCDASQVDTSFADEFQRAFWWCVGTAEVSSNHPIAKCLVQRASCALDCATFPVPEHFRYTIGRGVSAVLAGGAIDVRVGSLSFFEDSARELEQDISSHPAFHAVTRWASDKGSMQDSVVVVHAIFAKRAYILGALAVHDEVRSEAPAVIRHLREQHGLEVWMCTGDGAATARAVAREVGILEEHVCAEALPEGKSKLIQALRQKHGPRVCMVGDGINDAPALAAADVGVAVGAGASLAMDAADVVVVRSDLRMVATYIELSRMTVRTIWRNFAWAFVFNICGLPLAAGLFYPTIVMPPLPAAVAMALSSALVVSSSLSIRSFQPPVLS
jgi:Cu+-exporting ATPase